MRWTKAFHIFCPLVSLNDPQPLILRKSHHLNSHPTSTTELGQEGGERGMLTRPHFSFFFFFFSTQPKKPTFVQAQFDFLAENPSQLSFCRGDILKILDCSDPHWWRGKLGVKMGLFPRNYVFPLRM